MRILFLQNYLKIVGGTESYAHDVCQLLRNRGHDVLVLTRMDQHSLDPIDDATSILTGNKNDTFDCSVQLLDLMEDFQPDIVHTHHPVSLELAREILARTPLINHIHVHTGYCATGTKYLTRGNNICTHSLSPACLSHMLIDRCGSRRPKQMVLNYRRALEHHAVQRLCPFHLVPSHYIKDLLVASGIEAEKVGVLPPYFAHHSLIPPSHLQVPKESSLVLIVARLVENKGVHDAIQSLVNVSNPCRMVIIGDGHYRQQLEQLATAIIAHRPDHEILFTGWLNKEQIDEWYRKAAIVVFPSRVPESFGIVGPEAMSHGCAVIGTRVGGVPEWLSDGETGFLVKSGSPESLAERIDLLLSDPSLARRIGEAGYSRVATCYTEDLHYNQLIALYRGAKKFWTGDTDQHLSISPV